MREAVILAEISILEDDVPMKNTGSNEKRKTKPFSRTYCHFFFGSCSPTVQIA